MRGEFIGVWLETWREIWIPVSQSDEAEPEISIPEDLFCELHRELSGALKARPSVEELAEIVADPVRSREVFEATKSEDLTGERSLVAFLEAAHGVLYELGGDALANRYRILLETFIGKFSLRYDLRVPCILCPTLPGVFASLIRDLKLMASQNAQLDALLRGYEEAIRDLRYDCSDNRIKTCLTKQFMLLEAMGAVCPGVTENSLGKMCDQIGHWPHATIKESLKKLYGFSSAYPGIRHGNAGGGALRDLEMRDLVAMSVLLAGFTPYLNAQFNAENIYRGQ